MKKKKPGKHADKSIPAVYSFLMKKLQKEKKIHFITPVLFTRQ